MNSLLGSLKKKGKKLREKLKEALTKINEMETHENQHAKVETDDNGKLYVTPPSDGKYIRFERPKKLAPAATRANTALTRRVQLSDQTGTDPTISVTPWVPAYVSRAQLSDTISPSYNSFVAPSAYAAPRPAASAAIPWVTGQEVIDLVADPRYVGLSRAQQARNQGRQAGPGPKTSAYRSDFN